MENNSGSGMGRDRDLVLAPGEFAYVLDTTKGLVNTIVGPNKISMSNTDQPVVWDKQKRRHISTDAERAKQINSIAPEGYYIALYNPADAQPREGAQLPSAQLHVGNRVNIPGPANFALWPGQMATVIQGHHLRSNQYVLAQVYNDVEATKNWQHAVLKPQTGETAAVATPSPKSFTPGQLLIIKGTEVAFFIPPTGVKVVPEKEKQYVREAVTLERLEYCILLDEEGNKRFVRGPDVVFPEPTEKFVEKDGSRKFKAIDLNATTGLYVKVIADYKDEKGVEHKAGDELFITGKEQAIYFQREEHSIIRYGDQTKHYAVAVPAGEGRYVLNRTTGEVKLVKGPVMLLCDPRTEVIVRRVLAEKTAQLWYPDNQKVLEVNRELAAQTAEGDKSGYEAGRTGQTANYMVTAASLGDARSRQIAGDTFMRGSAFTPPRTITLDTKYEGAVSVNIWTGYAVLVIDKTGHRRVVEGPETVLLEYDETLAPLELSTGKPKTNDRLFKTVYLRVTNNVVSDIITVETKDLVRVKIAVSYRVNFEGDEKVQWFAVENYVRLLCDHMRSLIRNAVKRYGIEAFYAGAIDLIRDAALGKAEAGKDRPGRAFAENAMRVYDAEVLDVTIEDKAIGALLSTTQAEALQLAIRVSKEERELEATRKSEEFKQQTVEAKARTFELSADATGREVQAAKAVNLAKVNADADIQAARLDSQREDQEKLSAIHEGVIARQRATDEAATKARQAQVEVELKRIIGETEEIVKRAAAINPNLAVALTAFADSALIERMTTALGPMAAMNGVSTADILKQMFDGTPFAGVMEALGARARMPVGLTK